MLSDTTLDAADDIISDLCRQLLTNSLVMEYKEIINTYILVTIRVPLRSHLVPLALLTFDSTWVRCMMGYIGGWWSSVVSLVMMIVGSAPTRVAMWHLNEVVRPVHRLKKLFSSCHFPSCLIRVHRPIRMNWGIAAWMMCYVTLGTNSFLGFFSLKIYIF